MVNFVSSNRMVFFFLICLAIFGYHNSAAQVISPEFYQTEEDLLDGLNQGELTFDQYLELLDLMQRKIDLSSVDSQEVIQIPDLELSDLKDSTVNQLEQEKLSAFLKPSIKTEKEFQGEVVWQFQQRFSEDKLTKNYFNLTTTVNKNLSFNLEAQNQTNQTEIRRRSLQYFISSQKLHVILGNFQRKFGKGVNIGNRTYLNYSSDSTLSAPNTFLFPLFTRYNGIFLNHQNEKFIPSVFYSENRFGVYQDRIVAGEFLLQIKKFKIGPIFSWQRISDKSYRFQNHCGSIFGEYQDKTFNLSGEVAFLDRGAQGGVGEFSLTKEKYSLRGIFWSYSADFIYPPSGGNSNPDYELIDLENLNLSFRSRQAGENGIYLNSVIKITPRLFTEGAFNQWKDGGSLLNKNKFRLGIRYLFTPQFSAKILNYNEDFNPAGEGEKINTTRFVGRYEFREDWDLQLRASFKRKTELNDNTDLGDLQLIFYFPAWKNSLIKCGIKYTDFDFSQAHDSRFDFYLEERLKLDRNLFILAQYVSKNYTDDNLTDVQNLRIRLEAGW